MTYAKVIYDEILALTNAIEKEQDPHKLWGFLRRKRKLLKLYNVCVSDEQHAEIIESIEATTRGY